MNANGRTVVGYTEIPDDIKKWGECFSRQVVEQLIPDKAILVQYDRDEDLQRDRRNMMNAATRRFGSGRVKTVVDGLKLYIWIKQGEETLLKIAENLPVSGTFIQNGRA